MGNIEDQYVSLDAAVPVGPGQSLQIIKRHPSDHEGAVLLARLHIVDDLMDAVGERVYAVCLALSDGDLDAAQCLATYRKIPGSPNGLLGRNRGQDEHILDGVVRLETFRAAFAPLIVRPMRGSSGLYVCQQNGTAFQETGRIGDVEVPIGLPLTTPRLRGLPSWSTVKEGISHSASTSPTSGGATSGLSRFLSVFSAFL